MYRRGSPPEEASPRLDEIAEILAAGYQRLRARLDEQFHCSASGELRLDLAAEQSVCATVSDVNEGNQ